MKIKNKTEGSLLKSSVLASMLYGIETRSPALGDVKHIQTIVSGYERSLFFGPGGGLKEMTGNMTQTDIRDKLGTLIVQLEIDMQMVRYVGHIARMDEDRCEKRLLMGRVQRKEADIKYASRKKIRAVSTLESC